MAGGARGQAQAAGRLPRGYPVREDAAMTSPAPPPDGPPDAAPPDAMADGAPDDIAAAITRGVCRLAGALGWAPLCEVALANGRRADVLALLPGGAFAIIEVKSGPRDYLSDAKWPEYREFCDRLYFAVGHDFPRELIPADAGLIVADAWEAHILREAPEHALAPARRRALLLRFADLAARRLAGLLDPGFAQGGRAPLRGD